MEKKSKQVPKVPKVPKVPRITNLAVEDIKYNLNLTAFEKLKNKEAIVKMLPIKQIQKTTFVITHANPAIANAFKKVITEELSVKVLHFDIPDILTNDKEIIYAELQDRVSLIPIDQDIPPDTIYSLDFVANSQEEYSVVKTENLVQVGGKILSKPAFDGTYRLLELSPGKVIKISNIRIIEGHGYDHSKFSLTSEIEYQVRDFVDVNVLNEKGNIVRKMVKRNELIDVMKKKHIRHPLVDDPEATNAKLYNWKILLIPDISYQNSMDAKMIRKLQSYPVVLEDIDLRGYASVEVNPEEYFLGFRTYGNITPLEMLKSACKNLIERLEYLLDINNLVIMENKEKTQILIKGESHTIGELLKRAIFKLDPAIGLVNCEILHPSIRSATINIKHPEPIKIFTDAVKELISIFSDLENQFVELLSRKK